KMLSETDRKALYLVPLKALASEKYQDYRDLLDDTDYQVHISVGDRDSSGRQLASKDLIIMTVEKLDAILRHNPQWIHDVDLVVEDEIHLLNSENRGPTLEVTLTRLREMIEFQLLGLSATIRNADELADWLDATLIDSDYRPVDLEEGIHWQDSIEYYLNTGEVSLPNQQEQETPSFTTASQRQEEENLKESIDTRETHIGTSKPRPTLNILDDTFSQGHQAIMFVRSRKSAESEAEKAGDVTSEYLDREERQELEELADDIRNVLGSPTEQCKRLSRCVKQGTAFHHAGLLSQQRSMIEDAFRDDLIKTIAATPTLAAGVSLPAYRIIIRDVKRYTNSGLNFIPVLEYRQMAGRAGRPEHHDRGEAIAVAKNEGMKEEIRDRYILGEQEKIYSKLAVEPVLRMHALSLVATRFVTDMDGLEDFFSKTFYAHQYGDMADIRDKLQDVIENLVDYGFIDEQEHELRPTRIGKRVAELYIDPYSAHHMLETLQQTVDTDRERTSLALLLMICQTVEMRPLLRVRKDESIDLEDILQQVRDTLLADIPEPWGHEYDSFLESFKTALMLEGWISEKDEDEMMDEFNVTPGGIRAKVENADWLLYACEEMAGMKDWKDVKQDVKKLRTRIKHGIKEELVRLVKFKGIGRVRARELHDSGIETASDIRETDFTKLKKLIGKKTAKKLKEQVGQDSVFDRENVLDYMQD
ncbi:MAG: DEAD/DEAH box helicase, partial [Candidatus Nanohaloarchaea archaeon]|nr:DEAD/DEAH box helicase [Candidatus Nanohaloarchaea archaeon]